MTFDKHEIHLSLMPVIEGANQLKEVYGEEICLEDRLHIAALALNNYHLEQITRILVSIRDEIPWR